jgi:hypothetical protein
MKFAPLSIALAAVLGAGSLATTASAQDYDGARQAPPPPPPPAYDCSRVVHDNGTSGSILGALAGAALGSNLASHHGGRSGGAAIGAVAGALVGNNIGRTAGENHCYQQQGYYRPTGGYGYAPPPPQGYYPGYYGPPPGYYGPPPGYYYGAPYYGPAFAFSFGTGGYYRPYRFYRSGRFYGGHRGWRH